MLCHKRSQQYIVFVVVVVVVVVVFLPQLFCIRSDLKTFEGYNFFVDIYIKFNKTELVEIS